MSFQAYLDNIEDKTGLTPRQFVALAHERGYDDPSVKAGTIVDWLKADYGLGRGHAMALVYVIQKGPKIDAKHVGSAAHSDPSDTLWLDGKATNPDRIGADGEFHVTDATSPEGSAPEAVPGDDPAEPTASAFLALGVGGALLGAVTAVGVWAFNEVFGFIHTIVFDRVGDAIAPLGAWTLIPLIAVGGIVVALILRFIRPEPLGALPHVIDGVVEHDGRLNGHNAAVAISGAAAGIGFGMPLGADTPSAMIGGHLASAVTTRLGWNPTFVRALVVAGVAAGISSTFLAQLAAVVFAFEVVLGGFGGIVFVVPTLLAVGVAGS